MAGKLGANPTLQSNCDVSRSFITDRKGRNDDDLSQGAAFCTYAYLYLGQGVLRKRQSLVWGGVCMIITNEELENYLDFLNESEQETVTVNRNFLRELVREVFFYHGLAQEQADLKKSNQGTSR